MGAFDKLRGNQVSSGFWGEHTSTIDWCETNYSHSPYIAEFVNTLSNLPSFLIGLYGCYSVLKNGLRKRYALCYLGLSLIGVGSFGFHASLRWEWQLMDELPMIYVVSYAAYLVLDTLPGFEPRFGIVGPLILLAWDAFVTVSYICLPNPVYHQVAFAAILITATLRTIALTFDLPPGHPARRTIGKMMAWGIVTFATGFGIWNVDNIFCEQLRAIRTVTGPFGVLVEGHAYWHYMTGYGAYLIFTASILLHCLIKDDVKGYQIDGRWLPTVNRRPQVSSKPESKDWRGAVTPSERLD
ncbi:dihydroceramidase [Cryptococcus neoformans]|nr:dihydroceramidase [Cryptococcus neoformans var. grubii Bt1]OXG26862.1 dihydroceramidase [Cryptococcus neoformans var. grubii Ze90-1]OXH33669.1 dihydroceramidase [Cryptococcus neoformans var. grubii]